MILYWLLIDITVPSVFRHEFQSTVSKFQIFWVGAVFVYVLMALCPELGVCSCQIIDRQPVLDIGFYCVFLCKDFLIIIYILF